MANVLQMTPWMHIFLKNDNILSLEFYRILLLEVQILIYPLEVAEFLHSLDCQCVILWRCNSNSFHRPWDNNIENQESQWLL